MSAEAAAGIDTRSQWWREWAFLAGALCLAGFTRLVAAGLRGTYVDFDEAMCILLGRSLLSGRGYILNGLPNATFPFGVPLIAGAFYELTGSARWALNLPTAIFGALGVIPFYLLLRHVWGRVTAACGAALYAGFPAMLFLVPYVTYSERLYSGSEAIFAFFALSAAYAALIGIERPTVARGLALGLLSGIAFEVRQDASGYFFIFIALIYAAAAVRRRRLLALDAAKSVAAAVVIFALLAAPYLLWVRHVTGKLYSGPRFAQTFVMRDSLRYVITRGVWGPSLKQYFAPNGDDTQIAASYYGVSPWHRERLAAGAEDVSARQVLGSLQFWALGNAWSVLWGKLLPPGTWIFALMGLISAALGRRWGLVAVAAALVLPSAWVTLTLYVLGRFYIVPSIAMALFAARGVDLAARGTLFFAPIAARLVAPRRLRERFAGRRPLSSPRFAAAAYLALPLALSLGMGSITLHHARVLRLNRTGYERALEDKVDALLPDYNRIVPPGSRVVAWAPTLAVRTDTEWLALPFAKPAHIVRYARNRAAQFLVIRGSDGYFEGYKPDDVIAAAGADRVAFDRKIANERFVIIDLRDGEAAGPAG